MTHPSHPDLAAQAAAWLADDPDEADRAELRALLDDPGAAAELADRFAGRLVFGTAGLRGRLGAGPNRMNRAVVRAATAALASWLSANCADGGRAAGVVVGCDARHRSSELADETAGVLVGAGIRVHLLAPRQPTPLLAFAVRHLGAVAGVMITASHNPAVDNGYKLYLADGAQVVPPVDAEIEAAIAGLGPLADVGLGRLDGPLVNRPGEALVSAYLDGLAAWSPAPPGAADLTVVYTPLHGVGRDLLLAAFDRAGLPAPHVVAAQTEPDPDFPTVPFPNPEEPGALDLAIAEARRLDADLVLANDPDGDRLAVAVPDPAVTGGWRALSGDELGVLLADHLLERTAGEPEPATRLVATTVVSSTLLSRIAAAAGVRYAETLTGFKWIARAADNWPGSRFLFGYEEALGYCVGDVVRDKDGLGAALAVCGLAATARAQGQTLLDRLDRLDRRFGPHLTAQLTTHTSAGAQVMSRLRANPPAVLAGEPVTEVVDLTADGTGLPPADVLVYRLRRGRVVVRPSGTEPKLKSYLEVAAAPEVDVAAARSRAAARLARLRDAVQGLVEADSFA